MFESHKSVNGQAFGSSAQRLVVILAGLGASVVVVSAAPVGYQDAVLASTPYVYYRFNETSGTSAGDVSGYSRNGSYAGGPSLQQAGNGIASDKATSFSASGQYLASTAKDFVTFAGTSSYEFVLKVNPGFPTTTVQSLFGAAPTDYSSASVVDITLNLNRSDVVTANSVRFFARSDDSKYIKASFTNASLFDGNYHNLIVTYSGGTQVAAYVDGSLQTVTASSTGIGTNMNSAKTNMAFAAEYSRGTSSMSNFANVTLDEAALYPSVLSAATAANHAAAAIPEPTAIASGLVCSALLLRRQRRSSSR